MSTDAICETEPACLCGDADECGCEEEVGKGVCVSCGKPVITVDAETGEAVEA